MKKIISIVALCILMFCVWAFNVYRVNSTIEKVPQKVHLMGQWVEYGDNFYDKATENRNGYSVKVVDAEVVGFDEFLKQNNISVYKDEELFKPEYIYDVTVIIRNENNTKSGISMIDTTLNSINNIMQVDFDVFDELYPQLNGSISFSVKPGTEMKFHFPFVVANTDFEKICDYDYLINNAFYLNLSQYPIANSIEVKV